jgi:hypothetical protein
VVTPIGEKTLFAAFCFAAGTARRAMAGPQSPVTALLWPLSMSNMIFM